MGTRVGPEGDGGKYRAAHHEASWRRWQGGATYRRPAHVGRALTGDQEMGHVERAGDAWEWHTRAIPGYPEGVGKFEKGKCPTEFEARQNVERCWKTYLGDAT